MRAGEGDHTGGKHRRAKKGRTWSQTGEKQNNKGTGGKYDFLYQEKVNWYQLLLRTGNNAPSLKDHHFQNKTSLGYDWIFLE